MCIYVCMAILSLEAILTLNTHKIAGTEGTIFNFVRSEVQTDSFLPAIHSLLYLPSSVLECSAAICCIASGQGHTFFGTVQI